MELISSPRKPVHCVSPESKEFSFQYLSTSNHKQTADELFYKGQLLPLQMVPFLTCSPLHDSCCNLNPNEPLFEWPPELHRSFNSHPRSNSWSRKLKMKLKSSRAYLRSLFIKSACSDADAFKYAKKFIKKTDDNAHRRSFSGAIAAHCSSNTSSTSSSFNSSGLHELKYLRRSSSDPEIEVSIDAAIAHCKKSILSFGIS